MFSRTLFVAALVVALGLPAPAFAAVGDFGTNGPFDADNTPNGVSLGDLDGDGALDVVTMNSPGNTIQGHINDGTGAAFTAAATQAASADSRDIELALLDADDNLDAVVSANDDEEIDVFTGNGDGTFDAAVPFAACDAPHGVVTADFDEDGNQDVATACEDTDESIALLLGNGDGTLDAPDLLSFGGETYRPLEAGDLDGDGHVDLATVSDGPVDDDLRVRLGNGDGSFEAVDATEVLQAARDMTLGDFNADGALDIAVTSAVLIVDDFVSVFINDGNGGNGGLFGAGTEFGVGENFGSLLGPIDSADFDVFNGDDVVMGYPGDSDNGVGFSDDQGALSPILNNDIASSEGEAVEAGDLNGDGFADYVVSSSSNTGEFFTRINLPDTADVAITMVDTPDPVTVDTNLTLGGAIANNAGPDAAPNAGFRYELPAGVTFQSINPGAPLECTTPAVGQGGVVECIADPEIAFLATIPFEIVVRPSACGSLSNTVDVINERVIDPGQANNTSSTSTQVVGCVVPPPPDLTGLPADSRCKNKVATILGTTENDVLKGTSGDDVIFTGSGDDVVLGAGGDDIVCVGDGNDQVAGNSGDDRLNLGLGDDQATGNSGQDRLLGSDGTDSLRGGGADDRLRGGAGDDDLNGGRGIDRCSDDDDKQRGCEK